MRRRSGVRGAVSFGCIVWLAITALVIYLGYKIIPVKVQTSAFQDFIQEEAGFGSIKSVQQMEAEVLARARELDIPVRKDNLTIKRTREIITIEAHYEITLDFFNGSYKYVWKFDPVAERRIFNT
jgi:hypothetical protein